MDAMEDRKNSIENSESVKLRVCFRGREESVSETKRRATAVAALILPWLR